MKKIVALLLAVLMVISCTAMAEAIQMDKLTFQFVPSKDADVIITGTANLPELVKAEMAKLGYEIGEVEISVGTSYEATGEAMCAGAIGWAQVKRIVYGAPDPKRGFTQVAPHAFHPKAQVTRGVLENECKQLMQHFFAQKRTK